MKGIALSVPWDEDGQQWLLRSADSTSLVLAIEGWAKYGSQSKFVFCELCALFANIPWLLPTGAPDTYNLLSKFADPC